MKTFSDNRFCFDNIEVDPRSGLLSIKGRTKRLEPKVISLLSYFASHPNQVVSRQELINALWPNVVVADETVTRSIFALRNALGDDAKQPKYIETIPKKGYRFLVNATIVKQEKALVKRVAIVAAIVVLVGALAITSWQPQPTINIDQILPVTNLSGTETDFSLINLKESEQQKMLFVHKLDNKYRILIRTIGSDETLVLTDDNGIKKSPKWLDDNTVLYVNCVDQQCQIIRQHALQDPEIIYSTNKVINHFDLIGGLQPAVIFSENHNNASTELMSLSLHNGKVEPLRARIPSLPARAFFPLYSSNNNTLYITAVESGKYSIQAFDFTEGVKLSINRQFESITSVSFGFTDEQLLIAGNRAETSGLWLQDTNNSPAELLLRNSGTEKILAAEVDRKNKMVYYSNYARNYDLNKISIDGELEELEKLNSDAMETAGKFVNSEKQILFVSNRNGYAEVWLYDQASKETKKISHLKAANIWSIQLSNDGKSIALIFLKKTLNLAVLDIQSEKLISSTSIPSMKYPLGWSLDDQYIYVSEHLTDINLFKYDKKTLTQTTIRRLSGLFAQEVDNGKYLITFDYNKNEFIKIDLQSESSNLQFSPLTHAVQGSEYLIPGQVALIGRTMIVAKKQNGKTNIIQYPIINKESENASQILDTNLSDQIVLNIGLTGKNFLIRKSNPDSGDIMTMKLKK